MQSARDKERKKLTDEILYCEYEITLSVKKIQHIYEQGSRKDEALNLLLSLTTDSCRRKEVNSSIIGKEFREEEKARALYAWAQEQSNPEILQIIEDIETENIKRRDAMEEKAQSYNREIKEIHNRIAQIDEETKLIENKTTNLTQSTELEKEQIENIKGIERFLKRVFERTDFFKDEKPPTDPKKIIEKAKAYTKACPGRMPFLEFYLAKVKTLMAPSDPNITIPGLKKEKRELESEIRSLATKVRSLGFSIGQGIEVKSEPFPTAPPDDHKETLADYEKELKELRNKEIKLKTSLEAFEGKKINPDSPESKRIKLIGKERLALTEQIKRLEMTIKKKALELELKKLKPEGYDSRLFSGTADPTAKQTAYGKLKNEIQELTEKIKLNSQSPMELRRLER